MNIHHRHLITLTPCNLLAQSYTQNLASQTLQDVPNVVGSRVHSDCARNIASCRQAFLKVYTKPYSTFRQYS